MRTRKSADDPTHGRPHTAMPTTCSGNGHPSLRAGHHGHLLFRPGMPRTAHPASRIAVEPVEAEAITRCGGRGLDPTDAGTCWARLAPAKPRCRSICWPMCPTARRPGAVAHWAAATAGGACRHAAPAMSLCMARSNEQPEQNVLESMLTRSWPRCLAKLSRWCGAQRVAANRLGRIDRLEAILEIAQQWNQTREVEPLLVEMAEAATRLFRADRASDLSMGSARRKTLVGRPALGIQGDELRDARQPPAWSARSIQTGHSTSCRRNRSSRDQIARQVDKSSSATIPRRCCAFRCVGASSGELFGAFELINKQSGQLHCRTTRPG